jgi:hypothetical protein
VVNLARPNITERSFGSWAMGYRTGGSANSEDPAAMIAALIAPIEDATLHGYFSGFADLHMKAA